MDAPLVAKLYRHWRIRTMVAMFVGYSVYYFTRKNLSAATPALIADLGYTKTQIGAIWSSLYLAYGVSKFVNGVLGDRANPRYFMAIGLILSAVCNWFFGFSSSLLALGILWTLNGWVQGMGWPPCARLLTQWYSSNERGTKWAIWNTSHQVGGGIILILGGYLAQHYGWRAAFTVPALIAVAVSFYLIDRLRDTPESLGLPPIEKYRAKKPDAGMIHADQTPCPMEPEAALGWKELLFRYALTNRAVWTLAIANFFVYLVRYGAMDWAPTYLVEVKHSSIASAALKAAGFEFLGIAGSFLAGWASDKYFANRRSFINVLYMAALCVAVVGFWVIPPGQPFWDAAALCAIGFLVYGPQMLVGVCAADVGGKQAAATATGFTGLFGYLGSIVSGVGLGFVVDHYGWNGGFVVWIASAAIGAACFLLIPKSKT
jgi:phosphoglycerate transporter family protein